MEVILALTILVGSLVVLGELVRTGLINARAARDLTFAQLICESQMAEITAGITTADPVSSSPVVGNEDWLYSVELEPVDMPGVMLLRVTVGQNLPIEQKPVTFSLSRLIQDPQIELPDPAAAEEEAAAAGATGSTASGSSSTGATGSATSGS